MAAVRRERHAARHASVAAEITGRERASALRMARAIDDWLVTTPAKWRALPGAMAGGSHLAVCAALVDKVKSAGCAVSDLIARVESLPGIPPLRSWVDVPLVGRLAKNADAEATTAERTLRHFGCETVEDAEKLDPMILLGLPPGILRAVGYPARARKLPAWARDVVIGHVEVIS